MLAGPILLKPCPYIAAFMKVVVVMKDRGGKKKKMEGIWFPEISSPKVIMWPRWGLNLLLSFLFQEEETLSKFRT